MDPRLGAKYGVLLTNVRRVKSRQTARLEVFDFDNTFEPKPVVAVQNWECLTANCPTSRSDGSVNVFHWRGRANRYGSLRGDNSVSLGIIFLDTRITFQILTLNSGESLPNTLK